MQTLPPVFAGRGHQLALLAIVLAACGLALYWVFLVPIYQAPDEPMNLDYALAINEHGGLFRVHHTSYQQLPTSVHPYTAYLIDRTQTARVAFNPGARMAPEYGSREFYEAIEREAPSREGLHIDTPNAPFAVYPYGYYGLLALWIEALHVWSDGPVFVFFGARCLSVALLFLTLLLIHATTRRMGYGVGFSLFLTAVVGFLPLTSFVASAIQMDNLSFTLVSLCFYLAVCLRQQPGRPLWLALLGLAFGGLLVTKLHFFLLVSLPICLMLATRGGMPTWPRHVLALHLLIVPSLIAGSIHLWSTWGTTNLYGPPSEHTGSLLHILEWVKRAVFDFYAGTSHESFWGTFGWMDTPLIIRGRRTNEVIRFVIQVFAWGFLGLTLVRLEQVLSRLARVAWRGRTWSALRIAFSHPLINSYFLFTVFMIWLYVRVDNRFGAQGRNWLPLILPILLTGLVYAPRALTLRRTRHLLSATTGVLLLAFCVVGSVYGLKTIDKRFYLSERARHALKQEQTAPPVMVNAPDLAPAEPRDPAIWPKQRHRKVLLAVP